MLSPTRNSFSGRHRSPSVILVLCCVGFGMLCLACQYHVPYRPYISGQQPPLLSRARIAYEGDLKALANAGGFLIGTIDLDAGNVHERIRILETARDVAAAHGGTHIIFTEELTTHQLVQIMPDRRETARKQSGDTANYHSEAVATKLKSAAYVVIRVPKEKWHLLPSALRFPNEHVIRT